MSSTRTIRVIDTNNEGGITINTSVGTLGELKQDPLLANINWKSMKVTTRPNNATLNSNDSLLPDGDFRIYLTPVSIKGAGATESQELENNLKISIESFNEATEYFKESLGNLCDSIKDIVLFSHNNSLPSKSNVKLTELTTIEKLELLEERNNMMQESKIN